jgi:hypothetical protein
MTVHEGGFYPHPLAPSPYEGEGEFYPQPRAPPPVRGRGVLP